MERWKREDFTGLRHAAWKVAEKKMNLSGLGNDGRERLDDTLEELGQGEREEVDEAYWNPQMSRGFVFVFSQLMG